MSSAGLAGKAVLITGAGRGIGAATARLAARLGARIMINDIDRDAAGQVADAIRADGGEAAVQVANVGQWASGTMLVDACIARFGTIDGLVNNAGVYRLGSIAEVSEEDFETSYRINVLGSAACARAAAMKMVAAGRGAIVNVTSGAASGLAAMAAYGASKGAVASLTYGWAVELAGTGVRINAVSPLADTRMIAMKRDYLARTGEPFTGVAPPPEANAPTICFLLSPLAAGINGQVVRIDGDLLSMMTHPAILDGGERVADGSIAAVARAFERLATQQQGLGLMRVDCRPV